MKQLTKGSLEAATISRVLKKGERPTDDDVVYCMFNPNEYTLTKQNQWTNAPAKGSNIPVVKFQQGGAEALKLRLFFDTYEDGQEEDVRNYTQRLWKMMMVTEDKRKRNNKSEPPHVVFSWGKSSFEAVIVSLSQTFTLFNTEGIPLRTTVDISLQQVNDNEYHKPQNPTSGGGPPRKMHIVEAGERLDLIAANEYGDASLWRLIASENHVTRPLQLREGQILIIPALE